MLGRTRYPSRERGQPGGAIVFLRTCCARRRTRNPCVEWCNINPPVPITYRVAGYGDTVTQHDANSVHFRGSKFLKSWMDFLEENADLRYPNLADVYVDEANG